MTPGAELYYDDQIWAEQDSIFLGLHNDTESYRQKNFEGFIDDKSLTSQRQAIYGLYAS